MVIGECIRTWSKGSNDNIKAIVDQAFKVDKAGKINTGTVLNFRSLKITDEKWLRTMDAISDSTRSSGSERTPLSPSLSTTAAKGPENSAPFCFSGEVFHQNPNGLQQDTACHDHTKHPNAASSPPERIDDLFRLVLADGLPAHVDGKEIRYRVVTLRETNVADERKAEALSGRAVLVNGSYKLLVSESNFRHVLNMLHIESLACDPTVLSRDLISLNVYDKLSSRDLEMIEQRIFLVTLAAEVRYGTMTQVEFENIMAGFAKKTAVSGPSLLTDFTGSRPHGAAESDVRAMLATAGGQTPTKSGWTLRVQPSTPSQKF
jgi:phage FluMu protein gp41